MASSIDEITIRYEEDGKVLVKEIEKEVLSRGSWTTIMFLFQNFNRRLGTYDPPRVTIRRFQKSSGNYVLRSKFNVSGPLQARKIVETLRRWYTNDAAQEPEAEELEHEPSKATQT